MSKSKQSSEIEPISFLTLARQFYSASERVFEPQDDLLSKPLYFLYFHALELAFKAFLRSHNVPTRDLKNKKGHKLIELYEDCRQRGLVIGISDQFQIGNVVNLLTGANEDQGLRYFNPNLKGLPSLSWTRGVVQELIRTVELRLQTTSQATPLPASKLVFIWDMPK
jgi:hypothetical protein